MKRLHTHRVINTRSDALDGLVASISIADDEFCYITVAGRRFLTPLPKALPDPEFKAVCSVEMAKPITYWQILFLDFLERGRLPENPTKKVKIKRRAIKFVVLNGIVCQRSLNGILLLSIGNPEINEAMREVPSNVCDSHQSRRKLSMQVKRLG